MTLSRAVVRTSQLLLLVTRVCGQGLEIPTGTAPDAIVRAAPPELRLQVQTVHRSAVTQLLVTRDERTLISVGGTEVKLWDVSSDRIRCNLTGRGYPFVMAAVSDDGTRLAAFEQGGGVYVWDVANGDLLHSEWQPRVTGLGWVRLAGDERFVLGLGAKIWICDIAAPQPEGTQSSSTQPGTAALLPLGCVAASSGLLTVLDLGQAHVLLGCQDGLERVDLSELMRARPAVGAGTQPPMPVTKSVLVEGTRHYKIGLLQPAPSAPPPSPQADQCLAWAALSTRQLVLVDAASGSTSRRVELPDHAVSITPIGFGGWQTALATDEGLFDLRPEGPKPVATVRNVTALACLPHRHQIVVARGQQLVSFTENREDRPFGAAVTISPSDVSSVLFEKGSGFLLAASATHAALWDLQSGQRSPSVSLPPATSFLGNDFTRLVCVSFGPPLGPRGNEPGFGNISVWNAYRNIRQNLRGFFKAGDVVALDPTGQRLAVGSELGDVTIYPLDGSRSSRLPAGTDYVHSSSNAPPGAHVPKQPGVYPNPAGPGTTPGSAAKPTVHASPDLRTVAGPVSSQQTPEQNRPTRCTHRVTQIAWTSAGAIVGRNNHELLLWPADGVSDPVAVAFDPQLLDVLSADGNQMAFWRLGSTSVGVKGLLETGAPRYLDTGEGPVAMVRFSDSGKHLLGRTASGRLVVWDLATGQVVIWFDGLAGAALSADDSVIATWTGDRSVQLVRLADGVGRWLTVPSGNVLSAAFDATGDKLAVGGTQGAVHVFRLADLVVTQASRPCASMYDLDDRTWVTVTPDGYFTAGVSHTDRAIAWQLGEHSLAFGTAARRRRRPDAVVARLAGLEPASLPPPMGDLTPQLVAASTPGLASNRGDQVVVSVAGRGPSPVQSFEALVNGIATEAGVVPRGLPDLNGWQWYDVTLDVPHTSDRLEVRLVAQDAQPRRSNPVDIVVNAGKPRYRGALHVLAIGVDHYQDARLPQLTSAVRDAELVAQTLQAQEGRDLYSKVEVRRLTDSEATTAAINEAIDRFGRGSRRGDTVVVYVAAHGLTHRGSYYFCTNDTRADQPEATAVSWNRVVDLLNSHEGAMTVVLLDTCFAGGATGGLRPLLTEDAAGNALVFCASQANQAAEGDEKRQQGYFTKAVVAALSGEPFGDLAPRPDRFGRLSFREFLAYVCDRVPTETQEHQKPDLAVFTGLPESPLVDLKSREQAEGQPR